MDDKKLKDALHTRSSDVEVSSQLKYKTLNYIDSKAKRNRRNYRIGLVGTLSIATGLALVFMPPKSSSPSPNIVELANEPHELSLDTRGLEASPNLFSEFMQILDENEVNYKVNLEASKGAIKVYNIQIEGLKHYFVTITLDETTEAECSEYILRLLKEEINEYEMYERVNLDEHNYLIYNEAHPDILKYYPLLMD